MEFSGREWTGAHLDSAGTVPRGSRRSAIPGEGEAAARRRVATLAQHGCLLHSSRLRSTRSPRLLLRWTGQMVSSRSLA